MAGSHVVHRGPGSFPDGRFLATVGRDSETRLWSTAEQTEVATLLEHRGIFFAAAFTLDGARLATGGKEDSTIHIWDLPAICRVRPVP